MVGVLQSELLSRHGFVHGFSLRTGGVSEGAFRSLNLGRSVGDGAAAVAENLARFGEAVGFDPGRLYEVSQAHGARAVTVHGGAVPEEVRLEQADAVVAAAPGLAVAVRVADCVPVLLAHPGSGLAAAAHAGWRGCVARVVPAAIEALCREAGARPEELLAVLGPHIRVGAFEVGEDVAQELSAAAGGREVLLRGAGKPRADLAGVLRAQLRALGMPEAHIEDVGGCTFSEPRRFFSYRRDGGRSGRHLAVIRSSG
ncbi:MAG: peptidoglycan editing factor PgeF [Myxococcota bacterium]